MKERKIKLYIAISLNGKITEEDGSVSWLESIPQPKDADYGYADFYENVDTTIEGNKTYQQIMSWGIEFPYEGKKNYVFTKNKNLKNTEFVTFISENHIEFVQKLKKDKGDAIWLIGGGTINTLLLNENLIDEIIIFTMPIILTQGIDLFEKLPKKTHLELVISKNYDTGVVENQYLVKK